ncbi:hypothetical protein RQP46_000036 [Phenoliferia psychrophenolica]
MSQIASWTFNSESDCVTIIETIDKRLEDKGKNWRHVYKSLILLQYLLENGHELVVVYCRENLYVIKTLQEFQYIDGDDLNNDRGRLVRQKAREITRIFLDEKRLRDLRKVHANAPGWMEGDMLRARERRRSSASSNPPSTPGGSPVAKRGQKGGFVGMEEAMKLSREEHERHQRQLEAQSGGTVFDDPQIQTPSLIDLDTPTPQAQQPALQSLNPSAVAQMQQQQQLQQQLQQEEWARQSYMAAQQQANQQQAYYDMQLARQQEYILQQQYYRVRDPTDAGPANTDLYAYVSIRIQLLAFSLLAVEGTLPAIPVVKSRREARAPRISPRR